MSEPKKEDERSYWNYLALARLWLLARSRPQFHYAVDVLYLALVNIAMVALVVFVVNLFGADYFVNYDLVAHFVGPLGVGALVAGLVRRFVSDQNALKGWIVSGSYGGTSVAAFLLLLELGIMGLLIGFPSGAAFFMLLHWLYEIEAKKQRST